MTTSETPSDIIPGIIQEPDTGRRKLIQEIESATGRNVINYAATTAFGSSYEAMGSTDILTLTRVAAKGPSLKGVSLILNSPGGQPEAAEKIIMTLRHYYDDDFQVIVPESAKSAATIVALGADEIVMGYCSELGPIDPQVLIPDPSGRGIYRSAHAIIQSVDALVEKAHAAIKAGEPFEAYMRLLDFRPDLSFVEECRLAQQLSRQIAERCLKAKMLKGNPEMAEKTARALSQADELFSHSRAIDYLYAQKELGLRVTYLRPDAKLWSKIWELHVRSQWALLQNRQAKIIESRATTVPVMA